MGKVIEFKRTVKKDNEIEDNASWDKIAAQAKANEERLAKERLEKNKKVLRSYRIK